MWLTIFLFLSLTQPFTIANEECNFQLPQGDDPLCTQSFKDMVHDELEAYDICSSYFPTYSMNAQYNDTHVTCSVENTHKCESGQALIYGQCYEFTQGPEKTVADAVKQCTSKNAALPMIFSTKQGQFIADAAATIGLDKIWIGMSSDGIDVSSGRILFKDIFKLKKDVLWDQNEVKKPENGPYNMIFRTRTDFKLNLKRGYFEFATSDTVSNVACVTPAVSTLKTDTCEPLRKLGFVEAKFENNQCTFESTKFVELGASTECNTESNKMDMVILLDASGSVYYEPFQLAKKFIKTLIDGFTIGKDATRISIVPYASTTYGKIQLNDCSDKDCLKQKTDGITYNGGGTCTSKAFKEAMEMLENGENEYASGTKRAKLIITITDGIDLCSGIADHSTTARYQGIELFMVGVGDGAKATSDIPHLTGNDESHYFDVEGYSSLDTLFAKQIGQAICTTVMTGSNEFRTLHWNESWDE